MFKVNLDSETASEAASRILGPYEVLEGNKESFIEQLNTIYNKVSAAHMWFHLVLNCRKRSVKVCAIRQCCGTWSL